MVELAEGILMGSVSPFLRNSFFKRESLCLTIEILASLKDKGKVIEILDKAVETSDKAGLLDDLREMYPIQLKVAEEKFRNYFRGIEPF